MKTKKIEKFDPHNPQHAALAEKMLANGDSTVITEDVFHPWLKSSFRRAAIAVEGVAGSGKTTLIPYLEEQITEHVKGCFIKRHAAFASLTDKYSLNRLHNCIYGGVQRLKRPYSFGPAAWLLQDPEASLSQIRRALHEEAKDVERTITDNFDEGDAFTLIDRHWLTAVVNQNPENLAGAFAASKSEFGEPAAWVIMSAHWQVIYDRMTKRAEAEARFIDETCANQDPYVIGGRLAAFEFLIRHMTAPVFFIDSTEGFDVQCYNIFNNATFSASDVQGLATFLAASIVELAMDKTP